MRLFAVNGVGVRAVLCYVAVGRVERLIRTLYREGSRGGNVRPFRDHFSLSKGACAMRQ